MQPLDCSGEQFDLITCCGEIGHFEPHTLCAPSVFDHPLAVDARLSTEETVIRGQYTRHLRKNPRRSGRGKSTFGDMMSL